MSSIYEIIMSREMESMMMRVMSSTVSECSKMYNFNSSEAMEKLGLNMSIKIKKSEKSEKSEKVVKEVVLKSKFPLPFDGKCDESKCESLRQNHGLYTQCENKKTGEMYCKSCEKECMLTGGNARYGTIRDRMSTDMMSYTDPSGKKVVSYSRIMKKYKLTEDMVLMEAARMNKEVPSVHFEEEVVSRGRPKVEKNVEKVEKTEKKKGRPKSEKKVLELEGIEEDLFASLVAKAQNEEPVDKVLAEEDAEQKEAQAEQKKKAQAEQKEAQKKAQAEQKEAEKKAQAEQKEAQKKAQAEQKEAEKKAQAEQKEAEKKAKKEALEQEKKAKKEALEQEKKAKKEAAEAEKKAKKEAEKKAKKEKKAEEVKVEEDEETDRVKKIVYEGKKYLRSTKTGIIYNMDQEEVGKWNAEKEVIDFNEEEEEEEEEPDTVKKIVYEGKKYLKSTKTGVIYNMEQEIVGKWNGKSETIEFQDVEEEEEEYDE